MPDSTKPLIVRFREYDSQLKAMLGREAERRVFDETVDAMLADRPDCGAIMPGAGGFRKVRVARPDQNKGDRGGARLIYYYAKGTHTVFLFTVYAKNVAENLSEKAKQRLAGLVPGLNEYRPSRRQREQER